MRIEGAVALVTGANRGLGRVFVRELLQAGAAKVYAAARDPDVASEPGSVPLRLDITDAGSVTAAAELCGDTTLLINNAGIANQKPLIGSDTIDGARAEMEVNYFGTLRMSRACAPVLARNGGGGIVNVLSVASWLAVPWNGGYGASKAAALALTNVMRLELEQQGTLVVAVHAGLIDTGMTAHTSRAKVSPDEVVARTLEGVASGATEVLADARSRELKRQICADPDTVARELRDRWQAMQARG